MFAALGDETRLALLATLCEGYQISITQLASGSSLTRQAITKHLRVLEKAGLVHAVRDGRQTLFELKLKPIEEARSYLEVVSRQWDGALARLKSFLERTSDDAAQ